MSNTIVIRTAGHLALQEETRIHSTNSLKGGDFIQLKAEKPVNEKPYGWAEVLAAETAARPNIYRVRRIS